MKSFAGAAAMLSPGKDRFLCGLRKTKLAAVVAAAFCFAGCALFAPGERPDDNRRPRVRGDAQTAAATSPGILAYDFGGDGAMKGFAAAPGADNVTISSDARFKSENGGDFPDPLTGDWAEAPLLRVTVSGLSKGPHSAMLIAGNVVCGRVPGKDFRIRANGITVVDESATPERFFSADGFFYGVQFDDMPGVDWWTRYVEPVTRWRSFEFESNGRLVLELEKCRLYALVLAPRTAVGENGLSTRIQEIDAERKAHFLFEKFPFSPEKPAGRMRTTPEARERGYVVFSRGPERDVTYTTAALPRKTTDTISAAVAPGERAPVTFSVRALRRLAGCRVTVSDLTAKSGETIPSSAVSVDAVRYKLRRSGGRYAVVPELIQHQPTVDVPASMTKRWWLTLHTPGDAAPGLYEGRITFTPANAAAVALKLHVRVYPFHLVESEASLGVFYEDPRSQGYCTSLMDGRGSSQWKERASDAAPAAERYRVAMLDADLASLSEHGFNGVTLPAPKVESVLPDGEVRLDFSALEPYPALLRKYSINTDFPGQTNLLTVARRIASLHASGKQIEEYSELHTRAYKSAVAQIRDWWRERGVSVLAYVVDEPREKDLNPWNRNLEGTLHYLRLVSEVGGIKSTVTTMRDVENGVDYRPILEAEDVVQPHPSPHNEESIRYARKTGKPLRYFNGGGFRRYDFGFHIWSERPEGHWQWHFDFRQMSFNPFWESDVGYVVYPSPDGPLPTLRYERASQGIYDCRYALTLEDYILRAEADGSQRALAAARTARRTLADIKKRCRKWMLDKDWNATALPDDRLAQWRRKIADEILAVQAAIEPAPTEETE